MEVGIIKALVETGNIWVIISVVAILAVYKIVDRILTTRSEKNKAKQAKKKEDLMIEQYNGLISTIKQEFKSLSGALMAASENMKSKNKELDSINYRLKVIASQYGGELSKEAAAVVIQSIFHNFANMVANEIYELQKGHHSKNMLEKHISNRVSILNDEKMQELNLFSYRNRMLITYTTGKIVETERIIDTFNSYAEKNGMLRQEIESLSMLEASLIIKRLQ